MCTWLTSVLHTNSGASCHPSAQGERGSLPSDSLAKPRYQQALPGCWDFVGSVCYLLAPKLPGWHLPVVSMSSGGTSQQQQEKPKKELTHYSGRCSISTGQRDKTLTALFFSENFPKISTGIKLLTKLMPMLAGYKLT